MCAPAVPFSAALMGMRYCLQAKPPCSGVCRFPVSVHLPPVCLLSMPCYHAREQLVGLEQQCDSYRVMVRSGQQRQQKRDILGHIVLWDQQWCFQRAGAIGSLYYGKC